MGTSIYMASVFGFAISTKINRQSVNKFNLRHLLNFDSAASLWTCRINGTDIHDRNKHVGMRATDIGDQINNYFDGDFLLPRYFP